MSKKQTRSLKQCFKKDLKLAFNKERLLEAALYHPSFRNENKCARLEDFDRLEFFGDAILNYVICKKLFKLYKTADEGLLSRLRSILVSRKVLGRIVKEQKLKKYLHFGKSLEKDKDSFQSKIFADCLESLIAAYYLDQGLEKTERFILRVYENYFDPKKLFRVDPNPKSTLQEMVQKKWKRLPVYHNHNAGAQAQCTVSINTVLKAKALGGSRREAEEKAARFLIQKLRKKILKKKTANR